MLKYIKKAYIMSVMSYNETPGTKVEEVKDDNNNGLKVDELLKQSLDDGKIDSSEYQKLLKTYNEDIDGTIEDLKESRIKEAKDITIDILAKKLIEQFKDKNGEFEKGGTGIEFDEDYVFTDHDTFLSKFIQGSGAFYKKLGITPDDIITKIAQIKPNKNKASRVARGVNSKKIESTKLVNNNSDRTSKNNFKQQTKKEHLSTNTNHSNRRNKDTFEKSKDKTSIAQEEPETKTDKTKPKEYNEKIVVVKKRDTLSKIAKNINGVTYMDIYNANKNILTKGVDSTIYPGMKLKIPSNKKEK